jgi:hypothetical protein
MKREKKGQFPDEPAYSISMIELFQLVNAPLPFIYSDKAVGTSAASTNFRYIPYLYSKQGYKPNISIFWDAQTYWVSEDTTKLHSSSRRWKESESYNTKIQVFYPDSPRNFHSSQLAVCTLLPLGDLRAMTLKLPLQNLTWMPCSTEV